MKGFNSKGTWRILEIQKSRIEGTGPVPDTLRQAYANNQARLDALLAEQARRAAAAARLRLLLWLHHVHNVS